MVNWRMFGLGLGLIVAVAAAPLGAQEERKSNTDDRIEALAEEVRKLKLEQAAPAAEYKSYRGMGPAASKVYQRDRGLSIGGYGEFTYENFAEDSAKTDVVDTLRAVFYFGYRIAPWLVFNSEIEYEHAGIEKTSRTTSKSAPSSTGAATGTHTHTVSDTEPEVFVEFAYLDFLLAPALNVRVGLYLPPIGFINESHEPTTFHGVRRPEVEQTIIPTTWREMGVMLHGSLPAGIEYRLGALNGQDYSGISSGSWIRGARTKGSKAAAEDWAAVARLDFKGLPWMLIGGSGYIGNSGHRKELTDGSRLWGQIAMAEGHLEVNVAGVRLRGLYVTGWLNQADQISALNATTAGSRVYGWYAEAAYDILPLFTKDPSASLIPFVRYERFNTHDQVANGYVDDPTLDRTVVTAGLTFKPHPQVALKADYQYKQTRSDKSVKDDANKNDQVNVGAGYIF